ncbi:hypothetical protein BRADI_4g09325v3 [Brachypodium distachyon]|uniref:Uncharacterized protein n=1 Tax=Brachypodium distachyon TaxID=15368 RepID=A0A2K2CLK3_BRADI|nr:hypothetical protein BRADI_4g09325v3 [Brachypodium distachyon]
MMIHLESLSTFQIILSVVINMITVEHAKEKT